MVVRSFCSQTEIVKSDTRWKFVCLKSSFLFNSDRNFFLLPLGKGSREGSKFLEFLDFSNCCCKHACSNYRRTKKRVESVFSISCLRLLGCVHKRFWRREVKIEGRKHVLGRLAVCGDRGRLCAVLVRELFIKRLMLLCLLKLYFDSLSSIAISALLFVRPQSQRKSELIHERRKLMRLYSSFKLIRLHNLNSVWLIHGEKRSLCRCCWTRGEFPKSIKFPPSLQVV